MTDKNWPSLTEARQSWKFENDEVILDHIQHWVLRATEMGFKTFIIKYSAVKGTYFCHVVE